MESEKGRRGRWWAAGDVNAFFGLVLDNVTNLVLLGGILVGVFGMPAGIIHTRMIPGTALGVMVGDLVYTLLAVRLARRTGRDDVTAMPLGLDTPSTIGMAAAVVGPTYAASGSAEVAWQVGAATLVCMGAVKIVLSFCGDWVRRVVPDAGLLGSLAGVGLMLLAFIPVVEIFRMPVVGMVSLGLVFATLVAGIRLPGRLPGAFAGILAGTALYYALGAGGLLGGQFDWPELHAGFTPALPTTAWIAGMPRAVAFLPIALPFGLLTIVGGINVTQSARLAGDAYRTRDILLTEAVATLLAGLFGGVAQSTPYIGHPAYKAMGGRAGYTLATGLFVGLGGMLGFISVIVDVLPVAAVVPILLFIGLSIVSQAYAACPQRHWPAVGFAMVPSVGYLVLIYFDRFAGAVAGIAGELRARAPELASLAAMPEELASTHELMRVLGNGFILTAMIWGAAVALLLDRRMLAAAAALGVAAGLSLFGVIHSVLPDGELYLPWRPPSALVWHVSAAYAAGAALLAALHPVSRRNESC
jgi:AGZA family xanthine/uracil permease-like MFS transporter